MYLIPVRQLKLYFLRNRVEYNVLSSFYTFVSFHRAQYNVKGALLIGAEGMCISSRGAFNPIAAGRCTQVMTSAFRLHNAVYPPVSEEEVFLPTVTIETDQSVILINSSNGYYTAISYPAESSSSSTQ